MIRNNLFKKTLVFIVIVLFLVVSVVPCFSVVSQDIKTSVIVNPLDEKSVTCYVFDRDGNGKSEKVLSSVDFNRFYSFFKELNYMVAYYPFSDETRVLKVGFADLLDSLGLIPEGSSKVDVVRLLNPVFNGRKPLFSLPFVSGGRGSAFFCNFATYGEGSQFPVIILPRLIPFLLLPIPRVIMHWNAVDGFTSCGGLLSGKGFIAMGAQQGTALGFWGIGFSVFLPPVMSFGFVGYALFATASADKIIPWPPNRPPVVSDENPLDGAINVPLDLSELSFRISDADGDLMNYTVTTNPNIGSWQGLNKKNGVYSVPVSGLNSNTKYSWHVMVSDGEDVSEVMFSFRTAVEAPFISDPIPVDGDNWVSVNLSELSFRLEDLQGDLMNFTVETSPFIGSGSASGVGNGTFSVSIGGLDYSTEYVWFVNASDGTFWTRRFFVFKTQPLMVFDPFDEGWLYRKQIVVNHSQVVGDLVNFPVLVSVVDLDLRDKAQDDGDDILFMDGVGVADRLLHEIEFFDGSSGRFVAWVNVSNLSSSSDTTLYMYYGNSNSFNQEYPEMVWDSHFMMVQHLDETSGILHDSTFYENDGIPNGGVTQDAVGIIDGADYFDGNNDYVDLGNPTNLNPQNEITVSTWYKPISFKGTGNNPIVDKGFYSHTFPHYQFHLGVTGDLYEPPGAYAQFSFSVAAGGTGSGSYTSNGFWTPGHWYYIVGTYNGSMVSLYVNIGDEMTLINSVPLSGTMQDYGKNVYIAKFSNWNYFTPGTIDEIRISNIARTSEWITTEYNNQNDPSSFLSFGPEESNP